jgi:hypothetical protein
MTGPAFEARYPGVCAECGDRIEVGDDIRAVGGGDYAHVTCAPAPKPKSRFEGTSLEALGY